MLSDSLTENLIELDAEAKNAEEAITIAGRLLYNSGKVKEEYIDSMLKAFHEIGPYIVIAPGIAIPHGQPGEMVNSDCICFVRLKNPVAFGNNANDPVNFVFAIGGHCSEGHLDMLRELSIFLMNNKNIEEMKKLKTKEELIELIKKGGGQR